MTAAEIIAAVHDWVWKRSHAQARWLELEAEELAQETFLRIVRFAATFDPAKSVATTWAGTIVDRLAAEMHRCRRRHLSRDSAETEDSRPSLVAVAPTEPEPDKLDSHERRELLAAVGRLPCRLAAIVTAYFGLADGTPRTHADLAADLGVSRARVGQLVERALKILSRDVRLLLEFDAVPAPARLADQLRRIPPTRPVRRRSVHCRPRAVPA